MNPGVTEEAGLTLRSIINALGSQPFALSMLISNLLLLGFIWYTQVENNRQRALIGRDFFAFAEKTNALIAKCVVPEQQK